MQGHRQVGNSFPDPVKAKEEGEIHLLSEDEVDDYWPTIALCLDQQPELWNSFYTKESFYARAMNKELFVWAVLPAVRGGEFSIIFFTQVMQTDVGPQLNVPWMYGVGATRALNLIGLALIRFARETGCARIFFQGRDGWDKFMPSTGACKLGVTYTLEVKDLRMN